MSTELAVAAALACALCNATAALLQKASSDEAEAIRTYSLKTVTHLLRQIPYVAGLALDLLAGILTLIAVNKLPLFLVQAIIASCVVMTAFFEQWFFKRKLSRATYIAALVVVIGLACIAVAAHSESTAVASPLLMRCLFATPVFFVAAGAIAVRLKSRLGFILLAVLSGAAFGFVSIIGRVLVYPDPFWNVFANPLIWVIIADGAIGMYLFTAALQRTLATIVNGVMTSSETIVPILVGIVFLGDTARNGLWAFVWIGCALVIGGCGYISFTG